MRIAILGCGAMGTVMGAYLARNGCPVDMIDSYKEHVEALRTVGATVTGCAEFTVPVTALLPEEMEGIYDLVFLFTKQTANDVVLTQLLPHLGPDSTVCTLQNGVPEPMVAKYVGESRTVGGTVLWGATFKGPGTSELTQDFSKQESLSCLFEVGEIDGSITPRINQVADVLRHMGPTEVVPNLMEARWFKLMANACMSGMSAACGSTFGGVLDNAKASACLCHIGHEVKACCEAAGYRLPQTQDCLALESQEQFDESLRMFHGIYDCQLQAKASMLQDLEKGRRTEVRMINGFVCDAGDKYGIETPFNDAVVNIVTKIENGEAPLSMENLQYFDRAWFQYGEF